MTLKTSSPTGAERVIVLQNSVDEVYDKKDKRNKSLRDINIMSPLNPPET